MNDLTIGKNFDEEVKNAEQKPLIWINEEVMKQKEENVRLKEKVNQLETNIDELKKWLENHWEQSQDIWFVKVLNKIAELERGKE